MEILSELEMARLQAGLALEALEKLYRRLT